MAIKLTPRRLIFLTLLMFLCLLPQTVQAQTRVVRPQTGITVPFVNLKVSPPQTQKQSAYAIQVLLVLTILSLAPSIVILMTSFLRIAIVLDLVRRALSLNNMPPNTILFGIALFLSLFIMWTPLTQVYKEAFHPYAQGKINTSQFYQKAQKPMRYFMYKQMAGSNFKDVALFMKLSHLPAPKNFAQVPTYVLIPAFVLNELTIAFKMGILIYIPFIIIDMVVASVLMSMGMVMLPPVMISLPFKLILFVLVNGWGLITTELIKSFF